MKYYCDGSTYMNGQEGQDSSYLVKYDDQIIREHLGDFSINYAELYAIYKASTLANLGDMIVTDSQIAKIWATKIMKRKFRETMPAETIKLREKTFNLVMKEKFLTITCVPREVNEAGKEIEANPFYGGVENHKIRLEKWKQTRPKKASKEKQAYNYFADNYGIDEETIKIKLGIK